jgi:hypothetical protein
MTRSITGLFATKRQVDSVDGALRDAGFESERITIMGPDGQVVGALGAARVRRGAGAWLVEHLVHRGHPAAQAQQYRDSIAHEGRWLVTATIGNDAEDADARNLMVTGGANEISSVTDGKMVSVFRPAKNDADQS